MGVCTLHGFAWVRNFNVGSKFCAIPKFDLGPNFGIGLKFDVVLKLKQFYGPGCAFTNLTCFLGFCRLKRMFKILPKVVVKRS